MPSNRCRWCAGELPAGATICPRCQRKQDADLRPLRGAEASSAPPSDGRAVRGPLPVPPVREQTSERASATLPPSSDRERVGYWGVLVGHIRSDPLFALLLAGVVTAAASLFISGHPFLGTLVCVVLWGLLTFQYLVYAIVVTLWGGGLLLVGLDRVVLLATGVSGPIVMLGDVITLGWQAFILVVLLKRRHYYL